MSFVKRGSGNVFLQIDATEEMQYLTSTGVGDVNIPSRPRTIKYDPDVTRSGEWIASEFIRGEPSELTAPFQRPLDTVENYLLELMCSVNARINWACRGDRNIVWNYELATVLLGGEFESGSIGQPAIAQPSEEDRVATGGSLKALAWSFVYLLVSSQQTVPTQQDIHDIAFVPEECGDRCGRRIRMGYEGYAGQDTLGYLVGDNMLQTADAGAVWAATATDPFAGARAVMCMLIVETATGYRIIAGGGTEAGQPAAVAYSDDLGATWTTITMGNVAGQSVNGICRDILGRMWVCCSGGDVYRSNNLAMTWVLMHNHTETAQDLNGITFPTQNIGFSVGDNNAVIMTEDAGANWDLLGGPAGGIDLTSVDYNRTAYIFISAADGTLHRSIDYGANWVEVLDMGAGTINRVRFDDKLKYFGGLVWNNAAGVGSFMRSEDGGVTWMAWDTPANTGLNSLFFCDTNMIYIAGDAGFIAKFVRAST